MLVASELCKRYGTSFALHPLNLTIGAGEVFCLLGANGAGKTTTINLFLGFTQPSSGDASVDGVSLSADPERARQAIAYIPENVMLYPTLSGIENLAFFAGLAQARRLARVELEELLIQSGLSPASFDKRVGSYSKGMRQKVGIAIALAKRARALLLDEPTSGLDPSAANEFGHLMQHLARQGLAILMATHDLFLAKRIAHRIGIMQNGVLVEDIAAQGITTAQLESIYLRHSYGCAA